MPAFAAITLADGQASPVNHTFSPVSRDNTGIWKWADRSGGIALGFPIVSQFLRPPVGSLSDPNRVYRISWDIHVPVLEVTSPSTGSGIQPGPTLSYVERWQVINISPERSTLAVRKDGRAYVRNFLASSVVQSAVEDKEDVF